MKQPIGTFRAEQIGFLLLVTGAMVDSLAGLFTRLVEADTWTMIFWRGTFAGAFVLAYILLKDGRRALAGFLTIGWAGGVLIALNSAGMVLSLQSMRLTAVANFFMIFATAPFAAALLGRLLIKERIDTPTMIAGVFGFAGVAIMMASSAGDGHLIGDILALLVVLIYSSVVITIRRKNISNIEPVICLTAMASALLALPFARPFTPVVSDLGTLALFGIIQLGLGNILIYNSARMIPAAQSGLLGVLNCALAPLWVWLILGEIPPAATFLGGSLVIAGALGRLAWSFSRREVKLHATAGA